MKKKSLPFLIFAFFIYSFCLFPQQKNIRSSYSYIQTCYQKSTCFSHAQSAFVFYDANKEQLSISIDFSGFKLGVDSLDEWLLDLTDSKLIFTSEFSSSLVSSMSNHGSKNFKLKGKLSLNGIESFHSAEAIFFEISEQNLDFQSSQNNEFEKLRLHFAISFLPKEFGINKKAHNLKKTIFINIGSGYINYLRQ